MHAKILRGSVFLHTAGSRIMNSFVHSACCNTDSCLVQHGAIAHSVSKGGAIEFKLSGH